ncbi:tubulin-tyrosine ligase family-domain-containing protein [Gorgonomyces haynaldii]|nr:tubulin-tyrosine ligase family-domain-containing protein [Gorgonomyces haynaldii]
MKPANTGICTGKALSLILGSRYRQSEYQSCQSYQRLNHFPSTAMITKKDSLFRLLRTMKGIYGSAYDFFPLTYSVPTEFIKFVRHVQDESEKDEKSTWICKPADLSRGRGIFVFRDLHELSYQSSAIVQRYVPNPWLISGYKFDLRCYVLVRSFTQLTVYFYEEGLARFATSRFDMSSLDNKFSHLTNTSINKFSPFLNSDKDEVGPGCKWTIAQLRSYCEAKNVDFQKLWQRIKNIVILTLLPLAQEVKEHSSSCFELYGFDVLVDENLKPWLLEVNMSPALSVDSQVDIDVKQALLEDIIDLIGLDEQDADQAMRHAEVSRLIVGTVKPTANATQVCAGKETFYKRQDTDDPVPRKRWQI